MSLSSSSSISTYFPLAIQKVRRAVRMTGLGFVLFVLNSSYAGRLVLEFDPKLAGHDLELGKSIGLTQGRELSVSRLDFLVSGFALKPEGQDWMLAADDLVGLVRLDQNKVVVDLDEIPAGNFEAIRFQIGVPKFLNEADPNTFPANHPLHPVASGLHWGWMGGYVFLALEGYFADNSGEKEGYSYHLANEGNQAQVELDISFSTLRNQTLLVSFDVADWLNPESGVDPWSGKVFTHSREGDEVAEKLQLALATGFPEVRYLPEIFQSFEADDDSAFSAESGSYRLHVSNRFPEMSLELSSPLSKEGIELGEMLFFDPILSADNSVSCVDCHDPSHAFSDTKALSEGIDGRIGRRNSMPLFNLAWATAFFWDGRVNNLAEQALHPIVDPNEMGEDLETLVAKLKADKSYAQHFRDVFGEEEIRAELIGKAIEQYLVTLVSQDSRFDQAMRGEIELTEQEKRGFSLFTTEFDPEQGLRGADCFHCHGGTLFVSKDFANNGLGILSGDSGRFEISTKEIDTGSFKVPSLRNVAVTAPYMHDGRFSDLEEVVEHYNSKVERSQYLDPNLAKHPAAGLQLSEDDKAALVSFLETLTDHKFLKTESNLASSLPLATTK